MQPHLKRSRFVWICKISRPVVCVIWNLPPLQGGENLVVSTWEPKTYGYENISLLLHFSLRFSVWYTSHLLNYCEPRPVPGIVEDTEVARLCSAKLLKPRHTALGVKPYSCQCFTPRWPAWAGRAYLASVRPQVQPSPTPKLSKQALWRQCIAIKSVHMPARSLV